MAKHTFYNLHPDKRDEIVQVLKRLFQEKPFKDVTVKEIVEELGIARGSFYQYFEDLEDAYFTILKQEVVDLHGLFLNVFRDKDKSLEEILLEYGFKLSEILFEEESYLIYKNSYLYWDENLSNRWMRMHEYNDALFININGNV